MRYKFNKLTLIFFFLSLTLAVILLGQSAKSYIESLPYQGRIFRGLATFVYRVRDVGDLIYNLRSLPEEKLPKYYITVAPDELVKMNSGLDQVGDDRLLSDELRFQVPANFQVGEKKYKIEIGYRGAQDIHWNADKKSFGLRFDNKDLFEGKTKKLNLIIPLDRYYIVEHLNNYRAKKLGFFVPESHFATVYINNKKHGVYFVQEGWSDEFLKNSGRSVAGTLYKTKDIRSEFCTSRVEYYSCIKELSSLWEVSAGAEENMARLKKFFDIFAIKDNDQFVNEIKNYIDIDSWLTWNVHYLLVQSYHQGVTNLRFYYNPDTSLFEVVPWDVSMDMNHRHENIPSTRDEIDIDYNPFVDRLLTVPEFRHKRNEILWDYVKSDDQLNDDLKFYDETFELIKGDFYRDILKRKSNVGVDKDVKRFRDNIIAYYQNLKEVMSGGTYIIDRSSLEDEPYSFEVIAESFVSSDIDTIEVFAKENSAVNWSLYEDTNKNNKFDILDKRLAETKVAGGKIIFDGIKTAIFVPFLLDSGTIRAVVSKRFFVVSDISVTKIDDSIKPDITIRNSHTKKRLKLVAQD